MNPTPTQITAALQTLSAAGYHLAGPSTERCRLLNAHQVADLLSVSVSTARRVIRQLPGSVNLEGGDMRCRVSDLDSYLDAHPLTVRLEAVA
jgi:hypothetical protein